jgi:serine/threonine protein kinase
VRCRDIKPENILFDEGILKLADFGLALNSHEEHAVTRAGVQQLATGAAWLLLLTAAVTRGVSKSPEDHLLDQQLVCSVDHVPC